MAPVRLLVAYDGTGFSGFQSQPGQRTVQGVLETALARLGADPSRIVAAGRTDSGVHALGQVVSGERPPLLDDDALVGTLSRMLPPDVSVIDAAEAPEGFSARHDALWRSYVYLIWNHTAPNPLIGHCSWLVKRPLDDSLLSASLQSVVGTHDFSSFARLRADQAPDRTVLEASTRREGALIAVTITARSFLHQMVRSIVGTAVEVARGRRPVDWMPRALEAKDRAVADVAPAKGLTLVEVAYAGLAWRRSAVTGWPFAPGAGIERMVGL